MFKVKRNGTKMKKIFNTYAARRGLEVSSSEYFSLHIFNAILRYDIIAFADYLCHFFCSRARPPSASALVLVAYGRWPVVGDLCGGFNVLNSSIQCDFCSVAIESSRKHLLRILI